jgi:hypothetical protein
LKWENLVPVLELVDSIAELEAAIHDPETLLRALTSASGPYAKALWIIKLRPVLLPMLTKRGLDWEDVRLSMEMISTVEELQEAMSAPEAYLQQFKEVELRDTQSK